MGWHSQLTHRRWTSRGRRLSHSSSSLHRPSAASPLMPANRRGPIVCRCAFTIKLNVAAGLMAVAPGSLVAHSTCAMPVWLSACQRPSSLVHTVALWYGTPCRRLLTALCSEADARGLISFTYQQTVPCRAHSVAIAVGNFHRCVPLQPTANVAAVRWDGFATEGVVPFALTARPLDAF